MRSIIRHARRLPRGYRWRYVLFQLKLDIRRAWSRLRSRFDPKYAARQRALAAMWDTPFAWTPGADNQEKFK